MESVLYIFCLKFKMILSKQRRLDKEPQAQKKKKNSRQKEKTTATLRDCILQSFYVLLLSATQMTIIKNINLQFIKSLAKINFYPISNHTLKSPTNNNHITNTIIIDTRIVSHYKTYKLNYNELLTKCCPRTVNSAVQRIQPTMNSNICIYSLCFFYQVVIIKIINK